MDFCERLLSASHAGHCRAAPGRHGCDAIIDLRRDYRQELYGTDRSDKPGAFRENGQNQPASQDAAMA